MPAATRVLAFLSVFTVLFLFALAITVIGEFTDVKWIETIISIGEGLGRLTFVAIATTFILVEGIPMLAAWYKKEMQIKSREEGRQEGRQEGREQERKAWKLWLEEVDAWEQRKSDAEREGSTFHEPRPVPPTGD